MRGTRRIVALIAIGASAALPATPGTTATPTAADRFRALFEERLAGTGIDAARLYDADATMTIWGETGPSVVTRPFGEIVNGLGAVPAPIVAGEGPFGTPEVVAGNITDLFGGIWFGPDDEADANCGSARVQPSTLIPNTYTTAKLAADAAGVPLVNPTPVTLAPLLLTPIPGALASIVPVSSYALPAYAWLGPTLHITARYDLGLHGVGTLIGSNVSTATGADPYPVWTPMTTSGFVEDRSIEFLGQGLFIHASVRQSLAGYTVCGTIGALALSNGVAVFDNHPILGTDVAFPDLP